MLGRYALFTNGAVEVFDCAAQGRVDAFFLGGGQIDGAGNINLVGTGRYPDTDRSRQIKTKTDPFRGRQSS